MRYSLGTLVLLALWLGCGMWVYEHRTPWVRSEALAASFPPLRTMPETHAWIRAASLTSPDQTRTLPKPVRLGADHMRIPLVIQENGTEKPLYLLQEELFAQQQWLARFVDDNSILAVNLDEPVLRQRAFTRRYPEWWWGHFYRPEVWAFAGLSIVLLRRMSRFLFSRKGTQKTPKVVETQPRS